MLRDRIKLAARVAFGLAAAAVYVLALLPGDPHVFRSDKANHMLAFGALALLARFGWSRGSALAIGAALILFGVAIEISQALPVIGRDADIADVAADAVAVAGGLLAGTILLALIRRVNPA